MASSPQPVPRTLLRPVAGLLATFLVLAAISVTPSRQPVWFLVPASATLLLSLVTRTSPWAAARNLRDFAIFLLLFTLTPLLRGDYVSATDLLLRSLLSAWQGAWLITTFSFPSLVEGLQRLGVPPILVTLLIEIWRFLFLVRDEASRMRLAALNRGWSTRYAGQVGIRRAGGIAAGLLGRSLLRADRVELAMKQRGFRGQLPLRPSAEWRWLDYAVVAFGFAILMLAGWRGIA